MNRIERIPVAVAVAALRNGTPPEMVADFLQAVLDIQPVEEPTTADELIEAAGWNERVLSHAEELDAAIARHPAGKALRAGGPGASR